MPDCQIIRPESSYSGKQGFDYLAGIAKETTGSSAICMHLLSVPPGGRAKAHKHETHETAIYVLSGSGKMYWGERLEHLTDYAAGDLIYIPADCPHLPLNDGTETLTAVIARTDPNEQESVVLLPHLETLVPA